MPDTIAELEKSTIEYASGAFNAFSEDVAGMFGVGVEGTASDQQLVTLKELKHDFKKVTAVFIVESKGIVNGTFYVLLDQDALFTIAGTFVMLPEKIIIQNRRTGKEKEANEIGDAVGEVGNLLVGAWDKYFREEMEGHEHLLQTGTFIGKPWLKPEENIGLAKETELVAVKFEMSIEPFEPVLCMAAFPKSMFEPAPETEEKTKDADAAKEQAKGQDAAEKTDTPEEEDKTEPPAGDIESTEKAPEETPDEEKTEEEPKETAEKEVDETSETETEEKAEETQEETAAEKSEEQDAKEQATPETDDKVTEDTASENRPVSKVIEKMTQSSAVLPGEITGQFLTDIQAQNVMRTDIAWATQDDTVEDVLNKMQQHNIGYVLIGKPDAIQGIVSKSDIQGALSPYLQAIFSKWKRELDTATLQIKVRWIMSRPVHSIRPDAALGTVMETMCKHSVRALPVTDENGVYGVVTVYSIFNALNAATTDQAEQQGESTDVPALS